MSINIPMDAFTLVDQAFGTDIEGVAKKLGIAPDPNKSISQAEKYALAIRYPNITDRDFSMVNLVSDTENLASAFGMDRSAIRFVGVDDRETFGLCLNVVDLILSGLSLFPLNSPGIRDKIYEVAKTISKYIPKTENIGKLLAQAPGLAKYANAFAEFGKGIDTAISMLNANADVQDCITVIRDAIHTIRKVDIADIMKEAKDNKVKVEEAMTGEVIELPGPKSKKSKKKPVVEDSNKSDDAVAEAVAMPQQGFVPAWMYAQQAQQAPDIAGTGYVPEFMNPTIAAPTQTYVPEFMANIPPRQRFDPNSIFSNVEQTEVKQDWHVLAPFVAQIQAIANGCGIFLQEVPITDGGNLLFIKFNAYANDNGKVGGYLYNKSFVVDLGVIIDGRKGIWPCSSQFDEQIYYPVEYILGKEAYHLMDKDGKLNTKFIEDVFKYGFDGIKKEVKNKHVLYGERMILTNQRIDLITRPTAYLDKNMRSIITGACVRMATQLEPQFGRFAFESLDPKTLTFVLTNVGVRDYVLGPVTNRPHCRMLFSPQKDDNGNYIPINPNGGSDIRFVGQVI